jgi:hypothetical protein
MLPFAKTSLSRPPLAKILRLVTFRLFQHNPPIADLILPIQRDEMRTALVLILATSVMCGGVANAFIPPNPLPEVGWDGPGHLCESAFTFRVKAGEFVREDPQLEPSYPPSNTIKSEAGWFAITTLSNKPPEPASRSRLRKDKLGEVFDVPPNDPYSFDKELVFFPSNAKRPAVAVTFFKVTKTPPDADWRKLPQRSFSQSGYLEVLNRIVFARSNPTDCLNPSVLGG